MRGRRERHKGMKGIGDWKKGGEGNVLTLRREKKERYDNRMNNYKESN
jgi:hypothetical protein